MKKSYIFLLVLFIIGCSKPQLHSCFGEYEDIRLPFKVENVNGENLLGNKINPDSILIYDIYDDGCVELRYNVYDDKPAGFFINNNIITLYLQSLKFHEHNGIEYNIPFTDKTTYIKWNSKDTDTIFTKFANINSTNEKSLPNGYCTFDVYDKVYYNGELIVSSWEDNREKMSQGIYPIIIK